MIDIELREYFDTSGQYNALNLIKLMLRNYLCNMQMKQQQLLHSQHQPRRDQPQPLRNQLQQQPLRNQPQPQQLRNQPQPQQLRNRPQLQLLRNQQQQQQQHRIQQQQ